jgi:hypothetical protein
MTTILGYSQVSTTGQGVDTRLGVLTAVGVEGEPVTELATVFRIGRATASRYLANHEAVQQNA